MRIPHALRIVHGKFGGWIVMDEDVYIFGATTLDEVLRFVKEFWEPPHEDEPPALLLTIPNGGSGTGNGPQMAPRQREVLRHLVRGSPNKLIAHEMHISENTVKVYIRELIQAFGVVNRTQVVIRAIGVLGSEP